jgi:hypothetical protein
MNAHRQILNHKSISIPNSQTTDGAVWDLVFDIWDLLGIWCLDFVIFRGRLPVPADLPRGMLVGRPLPVPPTHPAAVFVTPLATMAGRTGMLFGQLSGLFGCVNFPGHAGDSDPGHGRLTVAMHLYELIMGTGRRLSTVFSLPEV